MGQCNCADLKRRRRFADAPRYGHCQAHLSVRRVALAAGVATDDVPYDDMMTSSMALLHPRGHHRTARARAVEAYVYTVMIAVPLTSEFI